MIKIYEPTEKTFSNNGLGTIQPFYCMETKKVSVNGWYLEIEVDSKYRDIICKDNIVLAETKEKGQQPFRIDNPVVKNNKISFKANHVVFDSNNYMLIDVRPTDLGPVSYVRYCNERTDKTSPYSITGNATGVGTNYFIRKSLLDVLNQAQETFECIIDADGFNIGILNSTGNDNGFSIAYGKNLQEITVEENWDDVCTRIIPEGPDGLMLPEIYIDADIQYQKPYTKVIQIDIPSDTPEDQKVEYLRTQAKKYLDENKYPKISYCVKSDVPQELCVNDVVTIKHPLVTITANVQEYQYDTITKRVKSLTFGNYNNDISSLLKNKIQSSSSSAVFEAEKNTNNQISVYDQAMQQMVNIIGQSMGLYPQKVLAENGSYKFYLSDMPTLETSKTVWTFVEGALAVSTDGGKTYNAAIGKDGTIIANIMSVNGLNADWINAGEINGLKYNAKGTINYKASDYSQADTDRMQNIMVGNIEPTESDYDKYDISGDGVISFTDLVQINNMINGTAGDKNINVNFTLNPANKSSLITVAENGKVVMNIGRSGISLNTISCKNAVISNHYRTPDSSGNEVTGMSGTFTTNDGKTVTVTNGIVTRVI